MENNRPIAFVSRSLSLSEMRQLSVDCEAMAIIECCRNGHTLSVRSTPLFRKTKVRCSSFSLEKKIKNEKLVRWRLELSEFAYDIEYKRCSVNVPADALSRICSLSSGTTFRALHYVLSHPGQSRLWENIQRHILLFSFYDVRTCIKRCSTCLKCEPCFVRPENSYVVKAAAPVERLSIDLMGPKVPSRVNSSQYV